MLVCLSVCLVVCFSVIYSLYFFFCSVGLCKAHWAAPEYQICYSNKAVLPCQCTYSTTHQAVFRLLTRKPTDRHCCRFNILKWQQMSCQWPAIPTDMRTHHWTLGHRHPSAGRNIISAKSLTFTHPHPHTLTLTYSLTDTHTLTVWSPAEIHCSHYMWSLFFSVWKLLRTNLLNISQSLIMLALLIHVWWQAIQQCYAVKVCFYSVVFLLCTWWMAGENDKLTEDTVIAKWIDIVLWHSWNVVHLQWLMMNLFVSMGVLCLFLEDKAP